MYCVNTTILLLSLWRLPITTILLTMLQDGQTALFHAAYWGGAAAVKMLVDYGATVDIQDKVVYHPIKSRSSDLEQYLILAVRSI